MTIIISVGEKEGTLQAVILTEVLRALQHAIMNVLVQDRLVESRKRMMMAS